MRRPAVALFDLGGVLLPFDPARRVRAVAQALAIDETAASAALSAELFARMDLGDAEPSHFAKAFSAPAGREVADHEAEGLILSVFEAPNAELWELLEVIRARVPVGGFSDNPGFVAAMFPSGAALDPMFWSAELRMTKAADAAFAEVETRLGLEGDAIFFVDDSLGNIERARRRGWDAAHFTGNDRLRADLRERGLA